MFFFIEDHRVMRSQMRENSAFSHPWCVGSERMPKTSRNLLWSKSALMAQDDPHCGDITNRQTEKQTRTGLFHHYIESKKLLIKAISISQ